MTRTSTVISKVAFLGDYLPRKLRHRDVHDGSALCGGGAWCGRAKQRHGVVPLGWYSAVGILQKKITECFDFTPGIVNSLRTLHEFIQFIT
jgi:hypothetical protein